MSRKYGDYFQLVRSYRDEGTVKKEVLVHLGDYETPDAALATWPDEVAEPGGTTGTNRLRIWQASSTVAVTVVTGYLGVYVSLSACIV